MKKFFAKVKNWFVSHKPTKRRLIQLYAALLTNANIKGFATGSIYQGNTKKVCVPGLNCYSCPGAVGACPLGALQDSLANSGTSAPAYIFGILILFGLILGRIICGFLCPFGLIQELLYKIRTPKLRKSRFTRVLSYFKYVLLAVIIAIPLIYSGIPSFCKYVCPAGTLEGALALLAHPANTSTFAMLGPLFTWKFCVLVAVIVASTFIYRFFCRFICPLGAIYSLFAKISLLGVKLDKNKCIDCGLCIQSCKMDVKHVGDHECIQCGECIAVCPVQAISWKGSQIFIKNTTPLAQPVPAEGEKIALLDIAKNSASQVVEGGAQPQEITDSSGVELNKEEIKADTAIAESAVTEPEITETVTEPATTERAEVGSQPQEAEASGKPRGAAAQAIKAAFKRPSFVVEFVAWVVALGVLLGALIGYGVQKSKSVLVYGVGDRCPLFEISAYDTASGATEFNSISSRGKVTVINFWYTMCDPCKEELPFYEKVYEEYDGAINMVAIHSWLALPSGGEKAVQEFLDSQTDGSGRVWSSYKLTFAQDKQELDAFAQLGGTSRYPLTVIVNAEGYITALRDGEWSEQELRSEIEKAME